MPALVYIETTTSTSPPIAGMDQLWELNAASAAFTHTLPDATMCLGALISLIKTDSSAHAVTLGTTSSQTILTTSGNVSTVSLAAQGNSLSVRSDGANWVKVAST